MRKFISSEEHKKILQCIREAEKNTSGEIRLYVEDVSGDHVLDRAAFIFHKLNMHKTKSRNGVLFYFAHVSRKFAVIGDEGINKAVPKDFWYDIKRSMENHFVAGDFVTGLSNGISMTGDALKKYFPHKKSDSNELPDDIVFGKNS